jgi:PfaD family protein
VAKVSRSEVADHFLSPAPAALLEQLQRAGKLTREEVALARQVPVAEEITAEADSGGHTDNRPFSVVLPLIIQLAEQAQKRYGYRHPPRVGAAGGLGTPASLAAAFAAGASYVVTGSVNQAAIESGLSLEGRRLLAEARETDVAMAPAADMFEIGAKVQVLKNRTFFAQRGQQLYELYRRYASLDEMPKTEREHLEKKILGRSIDDVWDGTVEYFSRVDPSTLERAKADLHHKMALIFRWYLFMGAQWARQGATEHQSDFQIWCGPAMGAFNRWVRGSFLEPLENRTVVQIALNLLEGAARVGRAQQLRLAGIELASNAFEFRPRPLA